MSSNTGPCPPRPPPAPLCSLPQLRPAAAQPFCPCYSHHLPDSHNNIASYLKLGLSELRRNLKKKMKSEISRVSPELGATNCFVSWVQGWGSQNHSQQEGRLPGLSAGAGSAELLSCIWVIITSQMLSRRVECFCDLAGTPLLLHLKCFHFDSAAPLMGG